jgi:aminoglycoside 3-N-acetyltransferase
MTFYHSVEEKHGVSYRFHKKFEGQYIDVEGVESTKTFGLFVRDVDRGVLTHVDPMGEKLWEHGAYMGFRPKENSGMRTILAERLFDMVSDVLARGDAEGLLYRRAS